MRLAKEGQIIEKPEDILKETYLKTQEKFYLADPGMRHAVLGYDPNSVSALMENIIYLELRARGYEVGVGKLDTAAGAVDYLHKRGHPGSLH